MQRLAPYMRRLARESDSAGDRELLAAFAHARDEEAFALLVRRHGPLVYGVCRRWLRQPADVDDAFQATFLVLVQRAHAIARPECLANWLHGVALRTARCLRNRNLRRQLREEMFDLTQVPANGTPADDELRPMFDEEINRLPAKYRLPVILCHLQGLSRRDAARQLGCPEGTLSVRLARALEMLRNRLVRRGVVLSAAAVASRLTPPVDAAAPPLLVRATREFVLASLVRSTLVPTRAATLAEGVLHMLLVKRLSAVLAAVFLVAAFGAGTGLFLRQGASMPLVAQSPAPPAPSAAPPVVSVKVQADDGGAMRHLIVAEDGDEITVTTARALSRYLKRARRDLPATAELTVLIERKVRTDVLESVAATCRAAGFARCQVKSVDGKPFELVSVADAGTATAEKMALDLDAYFAEISRKTAYDEEMRRALTDWLRQGQTLQESTNFRSTAARALLEAVNQPNRNRLDGVWQATEFKSNGKPILDNKVLARLEWIIAGDYLIDRPNNEHRVMRIQQSTKDGVFSIEIRNEGEKPGILRGTYTLTGDQMKVDFPGAATSAGGAKHDVSITFVRKPAGTDSTPRR